MIVIGNFLCANFRDFYLKPWFATAPVGQVLEQQMTGSGLPRQRRPRRWQLVIPVKRNSSYQPYTEVVSAVRLDIFPVHLVCLWFFPVQSHSLDLHLQYTVDPILTPAPPTHLCLVPCILEHGSHLTSPLRQNSRLFQGLFRQERWFCKAQKWLKSWHLGLL